jgi:hypothetical protein
MGVMNLKTDGARDLLSVADYYFALLGRSLPQQCASDEFYFLPRAEHAAEHLGTLDDMRPDRIDELLAEVGTLCRRLPTKESPSLEDEIDRVVLKGSMERFLWEFGSLCVWKRDPTLCVKIAMFAADRVLSQAAEPAERIREDLLNLFSRIGPFLRRSSENLDRPSEIAVAVAREMAVDAADFFRRDVPLFVRERLSGDREVSGKSREVAESWDRYGSVLRGIVRDDRFAVGEERLSEIFRKGLGSSVTPREALELAEEAYQSDLRAIEKLGRTIDARKDRREPVQGDPGPALSLEEVLDLYRNEVARLREFVVANDLMTLPPGEEVLVLPTPVYLRALRATASYRAPLSARRSEPGVFHITPVASASRLVRSHAAYLSAHETYPGHHLLDMVRIRMRNPIRRAIEAPLFYEGWACYAETLLDDLGYVTDPRVRIVQLQRRIWRDLRAILDVQVQTGRITIDAAAGRIEAVGFPRAVAERQMRRFVMTPGYQSCYFLGMHEIVRLRDLYAPGLGLKRFHDVLLQGGQIPFEPAEKRLRATSPSDR